MKERPILFSAPMVRAILAGSKTQTRRVVKYEITGPNQPHDIFDWHTQDGRWIAAHGGAFAFAKTNSARLCPYGQPGDRLWVRETHAPQSDCWGAWENWLQGNGGPAPIIHYAADFKPYQDGQGFTIHKPFIDKWRPSIFMPRWASRITLEVTDVRVERLQDISEADARTEGAPPSHPSIDRISREFGYSDFPRSWYAQLWDEINGPSSWEANPWVWAISFKRVKGATPC